jgi:hypothetical protein
MPFEWTEDDIRAACDRMGTPYPEGIAPHAGRSNSPAAKESKYHNVRTERDGITFDSKHEADRWEEHKLLLRTGEELAVLRQVPFRLPGGVVYRADFVILLPNGVYVVEDAKGVRTKEYQIKRKQMEAVHGIAIREV